jgi:CelD/BcsL family acetyltransferase involved in cellulose biosynthesis
LYVLSHEGAPVAALLMFYFGQSAIYYQAGWDPNSRVASLSPAAVLMARTIEDAISRGMRWYEFLRGDEVYKARWTKTHRNTSTMLMGDSLVTKGYFAVALLKDGIMANVRSFRGPKTTREDEEAVAPERPNPEVKSHTDGCPVPVTASDGKYPPCQ